MKFENIGMKVGGAGKVGDGSAGVTAANCAIAQRKTSHLGRRCSVALFSNSCRRARADVFAHFGRQFGMHRTGRSGDDAGEQTRFGGPVGRTDGNE